MAGAAVGMGVLDCIEEGEGAGAGGGGHAG